MKKKIKIGLILVFVLLLLSIPLFIKNSKPSYAALENHSEVNPNTNLYYYIDVYYDGTDRNGKSSNNAELSSVYSDVIYVEDTLPSGLIFKNFVPTPNGTIGAVTRSNGDACSGKVIDGVAGLKYDEDTRKISFKVKDLQAGCKLTVSIVTETPSLGIHSRLDFYNTAFAREERKFYNSNTVHTYIGEGERYLVSYEYSGDIPDSAPQIPTSSAYAPGNEVSIINPIDVPGYTFSGWTSEQVEVENNSFVMPEEDVVFKGTYKKTGVLHKVTYKIEGEIPEGYDIPFEREYYAGEFVALDDLNENDIVNGYFFKGWNIDDIEVKEKMFEMPDIDVVVVGIFEKIYCNLSYKIVGDVIPENIDSYLPEQTKYSYGDKVNVAEELSVPGYMFMGWSITTDFNIYSDLTIYGMFVPEKSVFAPNIEQVITREKTSYSEGQKVELQITITNNEDFDISDVYVFQDNNEIAFDTSGNYEVYGKNLIKIASIPANASEVVLATYDVGDEVYKQEQSEVSIVGAIAEDKVLANDISDTKDFIVSNVNIEIVLIDENKKVLNEGEFAICSDSECENITNLGKLFKNLQKDSTYYIKQNQVPSGYKGFDEIIKIDVSEDGALTSSYPIDMETNVITIVNEKQGVISNLVEPVIITFAAPIIDLTQSPNTGDRILGYSIIFIVSVVVVIIIIIILKKGGKKKNEKKN